MQILAIEKSLKPVDSTRDRDLLRDEAERVWALQKESVIREIWFTVRDHDAIILLECASEEEAKRQLATLPLVRANLIAFDVVPLRAYDGFDRLFERH